MIRQIAIHIKFQIVIALVCYKVLVLQELGMINAMLVKQDFSWLPIKKHAQLALQIVWLALQPPFALIVELILDMLR